MRQTITGCPWSTAGAARLEVAKYSLSTAQPAVSTRCVRASFAVCVRVRARVRVCACVRVFAVRARVLVTGKGEESVESTHHQHSNNWEPLRMPAAASSSTGERHFLEIPFGALNKLPRSSFRISGVFNSHACPKGLKEIFGEQRRGRNPNLIGCLFGLDSS